MTAPKTLEELEETVLDFDSGADCLLPDKILYMDKGETECWTSPRWAKIGDVVFFMFAGSAKSHLTRIRKEFEGRAHKYDEYDRAWLRFWINHGLGLHRFYGGKIFAIGRVTGSPERYDNNEYQHWSSHIYAEIDDIFILDNPVDISEFNDFIMVSRQSAITGVFGKEYERLMEIITSKNKIPKIYRDLVADPLPLSKINETNWFDIMKKYRCSFFLEQQFRTYGVDYFLREFGDQRKFFKEVRCKKQGHADAIVDNLVYYRGRWLPVEVKLSVATEYDLDHQLGKYMFVDRMVAKDSRGDRVFESDVLWNDRVLVVDTNSIYLYFDDELHDICQWDDATNKRQLLDRVNDTLGKIITW